MHVFCLKVKSLRMAMWIFPIYHYSPHCGKEFELSDESRRVDDEILTLIIFHEPLLRHIIGLSVDDPVDREDVYQETVVAILEHFRKGKSVEHPKAWMARIAKNKCADFHRRDERDTNRDIDLSSIINHAAFGGGVSITDDQHQAVVVKEIRSVISEMNLSIEMWESCISKDTLSVRFQSNWKFQRGR
ncbi:hypothetical protein C6500_00635 [Candidatus Poribacteria bacterium]|nr:MAG: hypothetical protein C6500_00635 [Candidatus Poribacteria bacterium]